MGAPGPEHEVAIIGAGFSGIGSAISLARVGVDDVVLLEAGDGFGGVWRWNTYPGVAVDIPSFSYQFSFERRSDWSRVYAPGAELRAYAEDVARRHGLEGKARFGSEVVSATWEDEAQAWRLGVRGGADVLARHVITAGGPLNNPRAPDIAGVEDFAGTTLHTARWDHGADLRGKRVAVIGTGASAVQVIPAIADEVASLVVFQRTPIWCLPKYDAPIPASARRVLERVPGAGRAARLASQALVELTFTIAAHYHQTLPVARVAERQARHFLAQQVHDPVVRDQLTPRYPVGCKRPSFHNTYLSTFNRDDVTLRTSPIERVEAHGIRCADGTVHELDVLVLATGFKVFEEGNVPPFPVHGEGGVDLESYFREHRLQAYEGVSVPGFPNLWEVFGPYGYNGSSYFNLVETQTRHIARAIGEARRRGATRVEVRQEANDRYFAEMLRRRGRQVFWQPGCALANSYYFDEHGDVPLRPVSTVETMWRSRRFPLDDYRYDRAAA